jgi:hypothetical protein
MREIQLTKGFVAVVDDEDYENTAAAGPWHAHIIKGKNTKDFIYAAQNSGDTEKQRKVLLHRFIMEATDRKIQADHVDRDGLNNQKYNLRR